MLQEYSLSLALFFLTHSSNNEPYVFYHVSYQIHSGHHAQRRRYRW